MKELKGQSALLWMLAIILLAVSCGGGGSSSSTNPPPSTQPLTITTASILPATLQGHAYTTALQATGGSGALHWSIAPISTTAMFVDGLTIDPASGVISGTANFAGTGSFTATVADSASHSTFKSFTITAYQPLQAGVSPAVNAMQYNSVSTFVGNISGGVPPLTYSVTGGALPTGTRLNSSTGNLEGTALEIGTYQIMMTVSDSFSPPETVSQPVNITVAAPPFSLATGSFPTKLLLNRPYSGGIVVTGGVPPYQFSLASGQLPPGLSGIDPNSGAVSGTPTTAGPYNFTVTATDSSTPAQTSQWTFNTQVVQPLGRNDTPATATLIDNGSYQASISPYIDPPNGPPLAADNDYYKATSVPGATVHVETWAKRNMPGDMLDTALEIVDGNGVRQSTCNVPGNGNTTFASGCMNDDISPGVQDSSLDFKVPGATGTPTTFYIRVLDWRGDARPDMPYTLYVNGITHPLAVATTHLLAAARGISYSQQMVNNNGTYPVTWSVVSGNLPPGLTMSASGGITGTATTDGTYAFTVQVVDSNTPQQTATAQESITVGDPVVITSSATWPSGCVNQPYSFAMQTSGGVPPIMWSIQPTGYWPGLAINTYTGAVSGSPIAAGTFTGYVVVSDATGMSVGQNISVTVNNCP